MTFHCRNYDLNQDRCRKLNDACIPGRRGCVLEGRVKLSEELEARVAALEAKKRRHRARGGE